jgi:hypothetical protein
MPLPGKTPVPESQTSSVNDPIYLLIIDSQINRRKSPY